MNNEMTTDNISNEEVIEVLKGIVFNSFDRTTPKERQALCLAIKSLAERPQGDLISREALKKAINDNGCRHSHYFDVFDVIDDAPPVETYTKDDMTREYLKGYNACKDMNERPQGEWIPCTKSGMPLTEQGRLSGEKWYGFKCSNPKCNYIYKGNALTESPFCQKCGADMKGGTDKGDN